MEILAYWGGKRKTSPQFDSYLKIFTSESEKHTANYDRKTESRYVKTASIINTLRKVVKEILRNQASVMKLINDTLFRILLIKMFGKIPSSSHQQDFSQVE